MLQRQVRQKCASHFQHYILRKYKDFNQSVRPSYPVLYGSVLKLSIGYLPPLYRPLFCNAVESFTIPWDHEERDFIFHHLNDGQEYDEVAAHVPDNVLGWRRPSYLQ